MVYPLTHSCLTVREMQPIAALETYIGTDESSSIIDILTFAMWALVVVGALAAIAGGVSQSVQVLVGGLTLFFGMAILIGVLEFTRWLIVRLLAEDALLNEKSPTCISSSIARLVASQAFCSYLCHCSAFC